MTTRATIIYPETDGKPLPVGENQHGFFNRPATFAKQVKNE